MAPSLRKPKKIVVVDDKKKEEIKQALNNYGFEEIAQEPKLDIVGDISKKMDDLVNETSDFGNNILHQKTNMSTPAE